MAQADDAFVQRVHDPHRVVVLNQREGNDPSVIWRLARRLCQAEPDVVHTHGWGTLVEGVLAAKLARVPIVVHGEHGTMETRSRNRWVQRCMWRFANQLLSVSHNHRQTLAQTFAVEPDRIEVIPNGVALDRFSMRAPECESFATPSSQPMSALRLRCGHGHNAERGYRNPPAPAAKTASPVAGSPPALRH